MKKLVILALSLPILAGCASPDARIRENSQTFDALGSDTQERVRQGEIDIGFNAEAVFLALGEPDQKYRRTTASGVSEVWSYMEREYFTDRQRVRASFRVRDSEGRSRNVRDSVWVDTRNWREFEKIRVEMRDGTVFAIEHINR